MSYIRQIIIQGFKSFSSRKTILNLSPGFTAIVGENGSGKSNILDAVAFVLGHLSSKSLRAENFASLLYNGGNGNPPAKSCRITLVFENRDRQFPLDADEVTISREVDTTGVSTYRIGGKRCTRTELLDTLSVAGVHPEGHNIVMQNELANIINMSTAEIRQIVEGVAGISVFDEKKRQIEVELEKVETNLQIIQVRTEEIRQEYSRLERDRSDALRWREITQDLDRLERDLAFAELARIEKRLADMNSEYEGLTQTITQLDTKRIEARNRKTSLEQANQTHNSKIKRLDRQQHSKEIESTRFREQLKGLKLSREDLSSQIESLSESENFLRSIHQDQKSRLGELKKNITELKSKEGDLKNEIHPLRGQLSRISEEVSQPETEYLTLREEVSDLTDAIEQKRSELGELVALTRVKEKDISRLEDQIEESLGVLSEQEVELAATNEEEDEKTAELQQTQEKLQTLEEERQTLQSTVLEHQGKQSELTQLIQENKEELLEAQTRLKTFREFQRYGLTRKTAVEAVLKFVKKNQISGVHGTLGSLGKTPSKHATALEVAGGGRLNFIVVDDEETAAKCINHLKKARIGRATFIPLKSIKPGSTVYKGSQKGIVGNAIDLLSFEEQYRPAFELVYGRTLIVNDLKAAREVDAHGFRKVTKDGDVVEPHRTLTGGFYKRLSSLTLEEEARIPELQKRLKELQGVLTSNGKEYQKWKIQLEDIEKDLTSTQGELTNLEGKAAQISELVTEKEEALKAFNTSIDNLRNALENEKSTKEELGEQETKKRREIEDLTSQRGTIQQKLAELERSELDPNLHRVRSQLDHLEENLRKVQLQLTEKISENRHLTTEQKRSEEDLEKAVKELEHGKEKLEARNHEISEMDREIKALEEEIEHLKEETSDLEKQLEANESEQRQLVIDIEDLGEKISEEKMKRSKFEARMEVWEDRLTAQKSKVEGLEPPLAPLDPSIVHRIRRQVADLEEERKGLGLINQKAVERFDEVRHAYDEILEKERRIREEREAILEAMHRAEEEKFRVFMAAFNGISQNFADVYKQLTNGEGQLELENPENPFLGGIRMKVRPAGKRIQYLDALSGGEKALTGLTFILALQLYQPAPFYFLDEIDESLDPNNADRVAKLIENLSQNSQFIIISHNEITIRLAHTLLGVAMIEGVSQVFSVKFEEGLLLIEGKS